MRLSLSLLTIVLLLCCKSNKEMDAPQPDTNLTLKKAEDSEAAQRITADDFSWLVGHWKRTDDKPGQQTFENWTKYSENEYKGISYTRADDKEVWREMISLVVQLEGSEFRVSIGKGEPTVFKIKKEADQAFKAENLFNDYPKLIRYWMDGDTLRAEISGGGPTVPYTYVRVKQK